MVHLFTRSCVAVAFAFAFLLLTFLVVLVVQQWKTRALLSSILSRSILQFLEDVNPFWFRIGFMARPLQSDTIFSMLRAQTLPVNVNGSKYVHTYSCCFA